MQLRRPALNGSVTDHHSQSQEGHRNQAEQNHQLNDVLQPHGIGNLGRSQKSQHGGRSGEDGIGQAVTQLEGQHSALAGQAHQIAHRRHDRHGGCRLARTRVDGQVDDGLHQEHTDDLYRAGQCHNRIGQGIDNGINDHAVHHNGIDRTGHSHNQRTEGDIGHALHIQIADLVAAEPGQNTADYTQHQKQRPTR